MHSIVIFLIVLLHLWKMHSPVNKQQNKIFKLGCGWTKFSLVLKKKRKTFLLRRFFLLSIMLTNIISVLCLTLRTSHPTRYPFGTQATIHIPCDWHQTIQRLLKWWWWMVFYVFFNNVSSLEIHFHAAPQSAVTLNCHIANYMTLNITLYRHQVDHTSS